MSINKFNFTEKELGTIEAVLLDFNEHRLPRLLDIKERVDLGEVLNEYEISFLSESFTQSQGSPDFAEAHPEFKRLVAQVADLYHHITSKALENEKNT